MNEVVLDVTEFMGPNEGWEINRHHGPIVLQLGRGGAVNQPPLARLWSLNRARPSAFPCRDAHLNNRIRERRVCAFNTAEPLIEGGFGQFGSLRA